MLCIEDVWQPDTLSMQQQVRVARISIVFYVSKKFNDFVNAISRCNLLDINLATPKINQ